MAKKSATTRLELARAAVADITRQIAALQAERNAALIADDDKMAAKLFAELEGLRVFAQGHADEVDLLAAEVELERAADVVRRHKVLLARFEKTLGEADRGCGECSGALRGRLGSNLGGDRLARTSSSGVLRPIATTENPHSVNLHRFTLAR